MKHRNALINVPHEAHVLEEIPIERLENLVGYVLSIAEITFPEEELSFDCIGHKKALHIIVRCQGINVAKVLIDNGFALNVCTMTTLDHFGVDKSHVRATEMLM
ncbi:hypothetical protein NL676_038468 [Syzygium grande]|nr:hypothetical protein NL676_038468 [Syzygium grande]